MQIDNFSLCKKILLSGYGQKCITFGIVLSEINRGELISMGEPQWQGSKGVNLVFLKTNFCLSMYVSLLILWWKKPL